MQNRNRAIVYELANRGHNVTVLSPYYEKNPPSNVHYIPFDDDFDTMIVDNVKEILNGTETLNPFYEQYLLVHTYGSVCLGKY